MPEYTLPRTGDVPVRFTGHLLAEVSSQEHEGPGGDRWHELALYRTEAGRYVLAVGYRSRYRGEGPVDRAEVCGTAAAVRDALAEVDPVPPGVGYPPRPDFREKQRRMEDGLRGRFARAVSELYDGLDGFAEAVE